MRRGNEALLYNQFTEVMTKHLTAESHADVEEDDIREAFRALDWEETGFVRAPSARRWLTVGAADFKIFAAARDDKLGDASHRCRGLSCAVLAHALTHLVGIQWGRLIAVHEEGLVNPDGDIAYEVSIPFHFYPSFV